MAPDYDAARAAPTSEIVMSGSPGAVSGPVWTPSLWCDLSPTDMLSGRKDKFIRYAGQGVSVITDLRNTDGGTFYIAANGPATSSGLGRLFVHYEVILETPRLLIPDTVAAINSSSYVPGVGITAAAPFGTGGVTSGGLDVTWLGTTLTLHPPSACMLILNVTGTGIHTSFNPTCTVIAGTGVVGSILGIGNAAGNAGTAGICYIDFSAYTTDCVVTLGLTGAATTITGVLGYLMAYSVSSSL